MADFFIDSSSLRELRSMMGVFPELQRTLGLPARFVVVLDANIAVADLIKKAECPGLRQTAIEECVAADSLELRAPAWLETEMTGSAIPKAAARRALQPEVLLQLWSDYRRLIIWDERFSDPDLHAAPDVDGKDIPYTALAEVIDAVGILSRDKDISDLGGTALDLQFVLSVRRYSRAESVHLTVMLNGVVIGTAMISALRAIASGLLGLFRSMPSHFRILILLLAVVLVAHPRARKAILGFLNNVAEVGHEVLPVLAELATDAIDKKSEAASELKALNDLLEKAGASPPVADATMDDTLLYPSNRERACQ